jgi:hypothetical protein
VIEGKRGYRFALAVSAGLLTAAAVAGVMDVRGIGAEGNEGGESTVIATKLWVSGGSVPGATGSALDKVS